MTEDRRRRVIAAAARLANGQPGPPHIDADGDVLQAWVRLEAAAKALGTGIGQLLTEEGVVGGEAVGGTTAAHRLDVRNLDVAGGLFCCSGGADVASRDRSPHASERRGRAGGISIMRRNVKSPPPMRARCSQIRNDGLRQIGKHL